MTANSIPGGVHSDLASRSERLLDTTVVVMALASTCVIVGLIWDISWHRSIGRDTFWTPAHLAIYLGGTLSGLACAVLVFSATFGSNSVLRGSTVRFWGFRAPIGAWVAIWGAIAMLTSAPFDNWWHNAYGLDVKVLSPPHVLLGLGMATIQLGALLLATSRQHAIGAVASGWRRTLPLWIAGVWLAMLLEMILEYRFANDQHNAGFYIAMAFTAPIPLAAAARGLEGRWPATITASAYTLITLLMLWILPLFPATPLLGPIYNPITHMVPPPFPLLLIVPAVMYDILLARGATSGIWWRAVAAGVAFVLLMLLVQWPLAEFLVHSPAARGELFGADTWNYNNRLGDWRYQFWDVPTTSTGAFALAPFSLGLLRAMVYASLTSALGIAFGSWLSRVRR